MKITKAFLDFEIDVIEEMKKILEKEYGKAYNITIQEQDVLLTGNENGTELGIPAYKINADEIYKQYHIYLLTNWERSDAVKRIAHLLVGMWKIRYSSNLQ